MGLKSIVVIIIILEASTDGAAQYRPWVPPDENYTGIVCSESCFTQYETPEPRIRCCFCELKGIWEIDNATLPEILHIEYVDIANTISYLKQKGSGEKFNFTLVEHTFGRLRHLPVNTCDYTTLVKMDFAHNRIESISNISCLVDIEIIDLSYNRINSIINTTFTLLRRLRHLDLSFNPIKTVDSNSFQGKDHSIFFIDLSNGEIENIDVTNFIFKNGFCRIIYDNNAMISTFVNPTGYTVDPNSTYGDLGFVSIVNSSITRFFNLSDFGLDFEYWNVLQFRVDTNDTRIACDCLAAEVLQITLEALKKFWVPADRNPNVTCLDPESLRGVAIIDLVGSSEQSKMICDTPEHCPKGCHCYSQPYQNHLVVNCSGAGLTKLPSTLPWGERYSLLLDGNDIDTLENREYLHRVYSANFSNTPLINLQKEATEALPNDVFLDFRDTKIRDLPRSFALKNPNYIAFNPISIDCECDNTWMRYWKEKDNLMTSSISCKNFDHINIRYLNEDLLDCSSVNDTWINVSIIISSISTFIIGAIILVLCYKPEMYLLYRHHLLRRKENTMKCLYDVYISFDETNMFIMKWVRWSLLPFLENKGYKVFLPCRDVLPGDSKMSRNSAIDSSRTYVVFMTPKLSDPWTREYDADANLTDSEESLAEMEFSDIWLNFKTERSKRIIVINFENVKVNKIRNRYLKAYRRTRDMIDITNRQENILFTTVKKIGPPRPVMYDLGLL